MARTSLGWSCAFALLGGCAAQLDADDSKIIKGDAGMDHDAEVSSAGCEQQPPLAAGEVRLTPDARFIVDGTVYVPRGVNSYPLLQHVGNGRLDALDDIFSQAIQLGRPLLRIPAFLDSGNSPARLRDDNGALREEGLVALDRVLSSAAEHGVRLLLILTNNWEDFGGAAAVLKMVAPDEKLPKNAFWSDPRAIAAQLAYQDALAARVNTLNGRVYRDDPTIFAWELANEARCEPDATRALCSATTLPRWAKRMSDGLRDAGVRQLIAWGGGGSLGEYGEDLRAIAADGGVDILTFHMYASTVDHAPGMSRSDQAIAWGRSELRARAELAREVGMPLLLEEVNWKPAATSDRDSERATVLRAWIALADELGVGTLPWMIGEHDRTDYDGYLIRPDDSATIESLMCTAASSG